MLLKYGVREEKEKERNMLQRIKESQEVEYS